MQDVAERMILKGLRVSELSASYNLRVNVLTIYVMLVGQAMGFIQNQTTPSSLIPY